MSKIIKAFLACSKVMPYSATEISDFFRCWKTLSVHFDRRAVWGWLIFRPICCANMRRRVVFSSMRVMSSAKSRSSRVENRVHPIPRGWCDAVCWQPPVNRQVEEQGRHGTSLSNTGLHTEAEFAVSHSALEVVVTALDDKDDLLWNSICFSVRR